MNNVKGYGIVNSETGETFFVWKLLMGILLGCIAFILFEKGVVVATPYLGILIIAIALFRCLRDVIRRKILNELVKGDINISDAGAMHDAEASLQSKMKLEKARILKQKRDFFERLVEMNGAFPMCQRELHCRKGESALYFDTDVNLCEQKSEYGVKRFYITDTGKLQITNKRIIFVGQYQNKEFRIRDIVNTRIVDDAVAISVSNRVKPFCFKNVDAQFVELVIKLCLTHPEWKIVPRDSMKEPDIESWDCDVSYETLCSMLQAAQSLKDIITKVAISNDTVNRALQRYAKLDNVVDCMWFDFDNSKLGFIVVADIFVSFLKMGHQTSDLSSPEGLGLLMALSKLFAFDGDIDISQWKDKSFRKEMEALLEPYVAKINDVLPFYRNDNTLYITDLVADVDYSFCNELVKAIYEWAIQIVGADAKIEKEERQWLGVLKWYSTLKGRFTDEEVRIGLERINELSS